MGNNQSNHFPHIPGKITWYWTRLTTVNHRPFLSDFFFLGEGRSVHRLYNCLLPWQQSALILPFPNLSLIYLHKFSRTTNFLFTNIIIINQSHLTDLSQSSTLCKPRPTSSYCWICHRSSFWHHQSVNFNTCSIVRFPF